jgi:hypothetical protein
MSVASDLAGLDGLSIAVAMLDKLSENSLLFPRVNSITVATDFLAGLEEKIQATIITIKIPNKNRMSFEKLLIAPSPQNKRQKCV